MTKPSSPAPTGLAALSLRSSSRLSLPSSPSAASLGFFLNSNLSRGLDVEAKVHCVRNNTDRRDFESSKNAIAYAKRVANQRADSYVLRWDGEKFEMIFYTWKERLRKTINSV